VVEKDGSRDTDSVQRSLAMDGPTAAGKSVIGRILSQRLSLHFCDTGLMYRAATWAVLGAGIQLDDESNIIQCVREADLDLSWEKPESPRVLVSGHDVTQKLREPTIEQAVSKVAGLPGVRDVLVTRQKHIASRSPVIMVGRDIGKVILPEARTKIFLDASLDERARRRLKDHLAIGREVTFEGVRESIARRDEADNTGHRSISADQAAEDAIVLLTDGLSEASVVEQCLHAYRIGNS
tara:strand:+ start:2279 stop:2992 length:714 start_codon:yes stop_codon:yes gene_type:complete